MNGKTYLDAIIKSQTLDPEGPERKQLSAERDKVKSLLEAAFNDAHPTIRYGGSVAKGTVILENYDLDVICYFEHDKDAAGASLREIFDNVKKALEKGYGVVAKTSALRLQSKDPNTLGIDLKIDVVPGRFTDSSRSDAFLYCTSQEKERLKTNLQKHIDFVKDSGFVDAIRLLKLWKTRNGLQVKTFALELLTIKILGETKDNKTLDEQLLQVWMKFRDGVSELKIEDPANPSGNDLVELLKPLVRSELSSEAASTLSSIERSGWESVFGPIDGGPGVSKNIPPPSAPGPKTPPMPPRRREVG